LNNKEREFSFSGIVTAGAIALLVAVIIILTAAFFYLEFSGFNVGTEPAAYLGTLGDFIGGMLNPVAAVLSVGLLAYTLFQNSMALKMSREELQLTRKEMERQANSLIESASIQRNTLDAESYRARSRVLWDRFERVKGYEVLGGGPKNTSLRDLLILKGGGEPPLISLVSVDEESGDVGYPEALWLLDQIQAIASKFLELRKLNQHISEAAFDYDFFVSDVLSIYSLLNTGHYQINYMNDFHPNNVVTISYFNDTLRNYCAKGQVEALDLLSNSISELVKIVGEDEVDNNFSLWMNE